MSSLHHLATEPSLFLLVILTKVLLVGILIGWHLRNKAKHEKRIRRQRRNTFLYGAINQTR